jgi:hypothetical protein
MPRLNATVAVACADEGLAVTVPAILADRRDFDASLLVAQKECFDLVVNNGLGKQANFP